MLEINYINLQPQEHLEPQEYPTLNARLTHSLIKLRNLLISIEREDRTQCLNM